MKIIVLDSYTINPGDLSWEELEKLGEVVCYDRTPIDDELEILNRIGDAEVVITNRIPISNLVLQQCSGLKKVCVIGTGVTVIDTDFAKKCGVSVSVVESKGAYSLVQTAFALLLEICHRIQNHSDSVYRGDWESCEDFCYWLNTPIELYGKTIGIVGDSIATRLSFATAKALGMNVIVYDNYHDNSEINYVDIDILIRESDIILLLNDSIPKCKGIICSNNMKKMKAGVIIINVASSDYILEEDLAHALGTGKVAAAAVDVVSTSPIEKDNPLLGAKNCIITPHLGWVTKENRKRILDEVAKNIESYISENKILSR